MDAETKDLIAKIEEVLHFLRAIESDFKSSFPKEHEGCDSWGHSLICGMKDIQNDESYYELRDSLAAWKAKHGNSDETTNKETKLEIDYEGMGNCIEAYIHINGKHVCTIGAAKAETNDKTSEIIKIIKKHYGNHQRTSK